MTMLSISELKVREAMVKTPQVKIVVKNCNLACS